MTTPMLSLIPRLLPAAGAGKRALILINTEQDAQLLAACWPLAKRLRICADGAADRLRTATTPAATAPCASVVATAATAPSATVAATGATGATATTGAPLGAATITTAYTPDVIIGDLDSVSDSTLRFYQRGGGGSGGGGGGGGGSASTSTGHGDGGTRALHSSEVVDLSGDQDSTDLDKALALAASRGCRSAVVVGAFNNGGGGRIDHFFGVVQSLFTALQQQEQQEQQRRLRQRRRPPQSGSSSSSGGSGGGGGSGSGSGGAAAVAESSSDEGEGGLESVVVVSPDCTMQLLLGDDDNTEADAERRTHVVPALRGAKCGLIPVDGACKSVASTGLKWDLSAGMTLRFGLLVSTSNEATADEVTVQTDKPLLWTMAAPVTGEQ
jgi:thiamine pyrophosphokinase